MHGMCGVIWGRDVGQEGRKCESPRQGGPGGLIALLLSKTVMLLEREMVAKTRRLLTRQLVRTRTWQTTDRL